MAAAGNDGTKHREESLISDVTCQDSPRNCSSTISKADAAQMGLWRRKLQERFSLRWRRRENRFSLGASVRRLLLKHFWICFRQLSRAKWTEEGATQLQSFMIEKRAKIKSHSTQISLANWENELLGNRAAGNYFTSSPPTFSLLIIIKWTIELVASTSL